MVTRAPKTRWNRLLWLVLALPAFVVVVTALRPEPGEAAVRARLDELAEGLSWVDGCFAWFSPRTWTADPEFCLLARTLDEFLLPHSRVELPGEPPRSPSDYTYLPALAGNGTSLEQQRLRFATSAVTLAPDGATATVDAVVCVDWVDRRAPHHGWTAVEVELELERAPEWRLARVAVPSWRSTYVCR